MTKSKKHFDDTRVPLTFDSIGAEEKQAAKNVLDSGFYTMGKEVRAFEEKFAEYTGAKHCVMVNSGSSANLLLVASYLHGLNRDGLLSPGDEVLVPALLWPTTLWPIVQLGLTPVLVDVNPETMSINVNDVRSKLTDKTKAIFLIHVLGIPANMDELMRLIEEHNLILIEDCCESLGARFKGKHVGTFGEGGTFSFFFSHHISTMEGGAIITNCEKHANDLRSMRAHGWIRDRSDSDQIKLANADANIDDRWLFVLPGFNLRPTEIQGAIGQVQISKIGQFITDRKFIADQVVTRLLDVDCLEVIGYGLSRELFDCSWMNIPIQVNPNGPVSKKQVVQIFEEVGFETRPIIAGNFCLHPVGELLKSDHNFPHTQYLHDQGFMISAFTDNADNYSSRLDEVKEKICLITKS